MAISRTRDVVPLPQDLEQSLHSPQFCQWQSMGGTGMSAQRAVPKHLFPKHSHLLPNTLPPLHWPLSEPHEQEIMCSFLSEHDKFVEASNTMASFLTDSKDLDPGMTAQSACALTPFLWSLRLVAKHALSCT